MTQLLVRKDLQYAILGFKKGLNPKQNQSVREKILVQGSLKLWYIRPRKKEFSFDVVCGVIDKYGVISELNSLLLEDSNLWDYMNSQRIKGAPFSQLYTLYNGKIVTSEQKTKFERLIVVFPNIKSVKIKFKYKEDVVCDADNSKKKNPKSLCQCWDRAIDRANV